MIDQLEQLAASAKSKVCIGIDDGRHTVSWVSEQWPEGVRVSDPDIKQAIMRAWRAEQTGVMA
jgi:hypothetical protein